MHTAYSIDPTWTPPVRLQAPLVEEEASTQARRLKALADPVRLQLLSLLLRHEGRLCVGELVQAFTLEQATISHHLRVLREAGFITADKRGLYAYYQVRREHVQALARWLLVLEEGA